MATEASNSSADEDWRLEFELDVADRRRSLHDLLGRVRGPDMDDVQASVPHDVVVTHDGRQLFAYAADESTLKQARGAIEQALGHDEVRFSVRVSHWDLQRDSWRQIDPPLTAEQQAEDKAAEHDAEAPEKRTIVASSGKLVREEFEQTMLQWADKVGVQCEIVEHPHLLTTQVAFTVTGPKRSVDQFAKGLAAEGRTQIRTETTVMLNPL
jgi:hypothetical protein